MSKQRKRYEIIWYGPYDRIHCRIIKQEEDELPVQPNAGMLGFATDVEVGSDYVFRDGMWELDSKRVCPICGK